MIRDEKHLASVAYSLIRDKETLTAAERVLTARTAPVRVDEVERTRNEIVGGGDPLGQRFVKLRSPELRRKDGATYTPPPIVQSMIGWAQGQCVMPSRVVDPGCGSGVFLMAAARVYPNAILVGIDSDPLAALMLRANASVLGFADRLHIHIADYRSAALPSANGETLFIGNPPYIRHHGIGADWKRWFATTAKRLGFKASMLAGMHIHFFLRTREIAKPGDLGVFVTAGEWMDVNYGSLLRAMLADGLGGSSIHVIDPKARPFEDSLVTGTITCFRVAHRSAGLMVRSVAGLEDLGTLSGGTTVPWNEAVTAPKWSIFTRTRVEKSSDMMEIGEIFRVHRGQVTGGNAIWIAGEHATELPAGRLLPAITKARELLATGTTLRRLDRLRRVIDLPADLSELDTCERAAVERFLRWARTQGADRSYIASHRKAWWSVTYKRPAAILCTYMARRAPHFVHNLAGARHLNIAHGLYPREPLTDASLHRIAGVLRLHATIHGGRTYAGGLVKFEPKELERTLIPRLEILDGASEAPAEAVDHGGTVGGRGECDQAFQA